MGFKMNVDHERAMVRAFFAPEKRARCLSLLSTVRGRRKLVSNLAHLDALDARFARRLDPRDQDVDEIERQLKERGAPVLCYVISENPSLDLRRMKLSEALQATVGSGMGTFISCSAGRLAYFEGEEPGSRYICERGIPDG
ncbi:MAG: hypothetical protein M3Q54_12040 [Actinomycetota bacterium]|nr:hypothetical protein [Actinomycetota bacterium]